MGALIKFGPLGALVLVVGVGGYVMDGVIEENAALKVALSEKTQTVANCKASVAALLTARSIEDEISHIPDADLIDVPDEWMR